MTEQELNRLENEIKQLNHSLEWYKNTYERRRLSGIIKDRFLQHKLVSKYYSKLAKLISTKKIKQAHNRSFLSENVLCCIVNYNMNENALKIRTVVSPHLDTIIIDSGSTVKNKAFLCLDNVYYSGLLNNSYKIAKENGYKYILFICSDVVCEKDQMNIMFKNLSQLNLKEIGVYSPSSSGRSHSYCKKKENKGVRPVPFVEGFMFLAAMEIIEMFTPIDLNINKFGWGLDVAKGFYCRQKDLLCLIDDEVTVHHPDGTGYSSDLADIEMEKWLNASTNLDFKNYCEKQINILRSGQDGKNKVSVIVPCYNQVQYLEETIHNIQMQEHGNIEIVLINDGSTDNTDSISKKLASQYSNIIYVNKENGGLGNTRNIGLKYANGEFIQFLDSDDILSPDKILNQIIDFINDPELDVSYSEYLCFDDADKTKKWTYSRLQLKEDPILDLIENWETELSIPVHCFLFRKSILDSIYFDEELPNHEDWEFHLKVAAKKPKYKYQPKGIAYYRVRQTSMSRDRELMIKGKKMCIQKAIDSGSFSDIYLDALYKRLN